MRQRYFVGPLPILLDMLNHLAFYLLHTLDHVPLEQLDPMTNPRNDTRLRRPWRWRFLSKYYVEQERDIRQMLRARALTLRSTCTGLAWILPYFLNFSQARGRSS